MKLAAVAVILGLGATVAPAAALSPDDSALTAYLRQQAKGMNGLTRYVSATLQDGATILVYLTGPDWCGSGGCQLLVLARRGDAYDAIGEISVARAPIRVLESRTNGRPDIGVHVAGGGVIDGYEAAVPFDGRRYARNPTVAPARRVDDAPGETLIPADAQGRVLEP